MLIQAKPGSKVGRYLRWKLDWQLEEHRLISSLLILLCLSLATNFFLAVYLLLLK